MSRKPPARESKLHRFLGSPYVILTVVGLLCHGILLFCDYMIWDGWLIDSCRRGSRFEIQWRQYSEPGIPHHYLVHRIFGLSENSVWLYKLVSFGAYLGVSFAFYTILHRTAFLKKSEALLAALLMLVFPGMMTLGEAALTPYVLGVFLFSIAACLAVQSEFETGIRHGAFRLVAITLFLMGLTYYGLVPFYLVFYLFFLGFLWRRAAPSNWLVFAALIAKRVDYVLIPPVFWCLKGKFAPTSGYFAGYNTPGFSFEQWKYSAGTFLNDYLFLHLQRLPLNPLVFLASGAIGWWLSRFWRPQVPGSWKRTAILAGQGCFAMVMAALPYIAVARRFHGFGYLSNSNLLVPFGASLVLVACIGAFRLLTPWDRRGVISNSILAYIVVSCISVWCTNYLHWQALRAKEQSLAIKLKRNPIVSSASVLFVIDRFFIPETDIYPPAITSAQYESMLGGAPVFAFNIADVAMGGMPMRIGRNMLHDLLESTQIPFFFTGVNLDGPQALILISRGDSSSSPVEIGLRDLYFKRIPFTSTEEYTKFSEGLVEVFVSSAQ